MEHEEVFDVLRDAGERTIDGKVVCVEGTTAWKTFSVKDLDGKVIIEKKFHKAEFNELLENPDYKTYLESLIDVVLTRTGEEIAGSDDPEETADE